MKLIPFSEFLSNDDEIHTFLIGYFEMFALWTRHNLPPAVRDMIAEEFHYYRFGKFLGVLTWIGIGIVLGLIFF